jgi:hypothetical protein
MKRWILACIVLLCLSAAAEAQQYYVPNMAQPYGGQWYWTRPVVPMPYYYAPRPYYSPYYGRPYGGYWDRVRIQSQLDRDRVRIQSQLDWLEFDLETLRRQRR